MASDGSPGKILVAIGATAEGGGTSPPNGKLLTAARISEVPASDGDRYRATPARVPAPVVRPTAEPRELIRHLNKFLNESGRPDQFRLDPAAGGKLIQQINPSTGTVIGEFSAAEFPALARSVGVAGLLVNELA